MKTEIEEQKELEMKKKKLADVKKKYTRRPPRSKRVSRTRSCITRVN